MDLCIKSSVLLKNEQVTSLTSVSAIGAIIDWSHYHHSYYQLWTPGHSPLCLSHAPRRCSVLEPTSLILGAHC